MKRVFEATLKLLLIMSFSFSIVSCSSQDDDGNGSLPSVDDPPVDEPIDDVPIGEVETTGFWVNIITEDQFSAYLNKRGEWGADCFIDADTTDNEHIECILDVMELDLYLHDLKLQYNAPPGMCDHIRIKPSWFWNHSSGNGPETVDIVRDTSVEPATLTSCFASAEPALEFDVEGAVTDGLVACTQHPELSMQPDGLGFDCVYDHRVSSSELPNCCFGNKTYTTSDDDGVEVTVTVESGTWDGDFAACISPHLDTSWTYFNETFPEIPLPELKRVPKDPASLNPVGLNDVLELAANISTVSSSFSTWANWYDEPGVANGHTHSGFFSATTSNEPYAVDPIDDLSGTVYDGTGAMHPGRSEWTIECLDSAAEIRQRIDVYIREWNTLVDFVAYATTEGVTYDPHVSGAEGTGCDYDPIFNYDGCNDRYDFTDVLTHVIYANGAYGTTPGVDTAVDRATYFPRISE